MSFNGSGTYVAPAGNPVTAGTTIQASWANTLVQDIGNTFNTTLPRDGQAAMSGVLKLTDGTVSAPAIAFNSESNTGLYRPSTNALALTVASTEALRVVNGRLVIGTTTDDTVNKVQITGNTKVTGALNVTSITTLGGNTAVTGTLSSTGTATLGNAVVSGTLSSVGATTLSDATITGNASVTGNLTVSGTLSTSTVTPTTLNVSGLSSFTGNVTTANIASTNTANLTTLNVSGVTSVTGNTSVGGNLSVTNNATVTGNVSIGSAVKAYTKSAGVGALQINGTDAVVFDSTGITSGYSNIISATPLAFRNKIINGGFNSTISYINSAQISVSSTATFFKPRWQAYVSGGTGISGALAATSVAGTSTGFVYGIQSGVSAGWTAGQPTILTRLEARDTKTLNSTTVTISGKIYHTLGSTRTINIILSKAGSTDNFSSPVALSTQGVSVPTGTLTSFAVTVALGASDATNGLQVMIQDSAATTIGPSSAIAFGIADIQLEAGAQTAFEIRPVAYEDFLCLRYIRPWFTNFYATATGTTTAVTTLGLPVPMRTAPTLINGGSPTYLGGNAGNVSSITGTDVLAIAMTGSSLTAGTAYLYNAPGPYVYMLQAEL